MSLSSLSVAGFAKQFPNPGTVRLLPLPSHLALVGCRHPRPPGSWREDGLRDREDLSLPKRCRGADQKLPPERRCEPGPFGDSPSVTTPRRFRDPGRIRQPFRVGGQIGISHIAPFETVTQQPGRRGHASCKRLATVNTAPGNPVLPIAQAASEAFKTVGLRRYVGDCQRSQHLPIRPHGAPPRSEPGSGQHPLPAKRHPDSKGSPSVNAYLELQPLGIGQFPETLKRLHDQLPAHLPHGYVVT